MTCSGICQCCKGACCVGSSCTQETCPDCEDLGGLWQGLGTKCEDVDCDDPCLDCYKIEYEWTISAGACGGTARTISGTVLIRSDGTNQHADIICYDDPDVVSVELVSGDLLKLNYGALCNVGSDASLFFSCEYSAGQGAVVVDTGAVLDELLLDDLLCCGESLGTYTSSFPTSDQTLTVTISLANQGECDCTGYTDVPP